MELEIVNVTAHNIDDHGLGCLEDRKHPGFSRKKQWMESQKEHGIGIKILKESGKKVGFVEFIDGEHAWRGVEAKGYLFIHCIWVYGKVNLSKGYGSMLINDCINDARKTGKDGVAVLCSSGSWLADNTVFLKNGFVIVDEFEKFTLLVRKFNKSPDPKIIKQKTIGSGNMKLTYAMQCPFYSKNIPEIEELAKQEKALIDFKEIESPKEAQNAPSPYGVFNLTYNGKLLADYYTSKARFKNILKKEVNPNLKK